MDIGIDQSAEAFGKAVEGHKADIVGASGLRTTTMLQENKLVEALKIAG